MVTNLIYIVGWISGKIVAVLELCIESKFYIESDIIMYFK